MQGAACFPRSLTRVYNCGIEATSRLLRFCVIGPQFRATFHPIREKKRLNSSTRLWLHVVLSRFDWLICVACSENFHRFEYNKKRQRHTLLESVLPRASSLMDVAIPSCKTKSTGFTTPDFEQGTFTTMSRTLFRRSSVGRASRKLSPSKTTSEVIVKVRR